MPHTNRVFYREDVAAGAALAGALAAGEVILVEEVRLHLDGASGAETFTIAIDSGTGTAYDVVLDTKAMNALTDYVWRPAQPVAVDAADAIDFDLANTAGGGNAVGLEVVYRKAV